MSSVLRVVGLVGLSLVVGQHVQVGSLGAATPQAAARPTPTPSARLAAAAPAAAALPQRSPVDQYCVTCHNQRSAIAGLTLDRVDVGKVSDDAAVWEKVVHKLRTGAMPPPGGPRPDGPSYHSLIAYLVTELDRAAEAKPILANR